MSPSDEWCNFGIVAGVFWIWRLGITFRLYGPHDGFQGATFTAYRFWPFVFVWCPRA